MPRRTKSAVLLPSQGGQRMTVPSAASLPARRPAARQRRARLPARAIHIAAPTGAAHILAPIREVRAAARRPSRPRSLTRPRRAHIPIWQHSWILLQGGPTCAGPPGWPAEASHAPCRPSALRPVGQRQSGDSDRCAAALRCATPRALRAEPDQPVTQLEFARRRDHNGIQRSMSRTARISRLSTRDGGCGGAVCGREEFRGLDPGLRHPRVSCARKSSGRPVLSSPASTSTTPLEPGT